ncbi:MAG: transposase [Bdellovibrionaceae bacterium]|nr:transposase [Bdellovibrio sp.]
MTGKNNFQKHILRILLRKDIKVLVIDMSNGYRSLIKEFFPNANNIADKFHMLWLITPALFKS